MKYKKERGQKRKLKELLNNINQICPFQNINYPYEHFHVPCSQFISSPKTSGRVKTEFCRAWLDKTTEIIEQKSYIKSFCKVVAVIDEFDLWASQIIIFYDENYFKSFWLRNSIEQTWEPIVEQSMSFIKKRYIVSKLEEKGYYETINDLEVIHKSILWFYGDIC